MRKVGWVALFAVAACAFFVTTAVGQEAEKGISMRIESGPDRMMATAEFPSGSVVVERSAEELVIQVEGASADEARQTAHYMMDILDTLERGTRSAERPSRSDFRKAQKTIENAEKRVREMEERVESQEQLIGKLQRELAEGEEANERLEMKLRERGEVIERLEEKLEKAERVEGDE